MGTGGDSEARGGDTEGAARGGGGGVGTGARRAGGGSCHVFSAGASAASADHSGTSGSRSGFVSPLGDAGAGSSFTFSSSAASAGRMGTGRRPDRTSDPDRRLVLPWFPPAPRQLRGRAVLHRPTSRPPGTARWGQRIRWPRNSGQMILRLALGTADGDLHRSFPTEANVDDASILMPNAARGTETRWILRYNGMEYRPQTATFYVTVLLGLHRSRQFFLSVPKIVPMAPATHEDR